MPRTGGEIVEAVKKKHGISYYRIAKELGIGQPHLIRIRRSEVAITERQAQKLGEMLGEQPGQLYAEVKASRAKCTEDRAFWEQVARAFVGGLVLGFAAVFPTPADAQVPGPSQATGYALSARRRVRPVAQPRRLLAVVRALATAFAQRPATVLG